LKQLANQQENADFEELLFFQIIRPI